MSTWAAPAYAGAAQASFGVRINLLAGSPPNGGTPVTGFCRSNTGTGAFGATITFVCSTGAIVDISPGGTGMPWAPMHGRAFRYVTTVSMAGETLGTVDSYTGAGTITSWRVVNLADLDYLEMMVHW
jgi:hypothetical protein